MRRTLHRLSRPIGGSLLALALAVAPAAARPMTVDDFLHLESFGESQADPTGRWLVFERRLPAIDSFRFDFQGQDEMVRTRLWRVDLKRPGPARPLFPAAQRAGYAFGPFSPDGRRIVVFRLTDATWELGVATVATGRVRWLSITPEEEPIARTVAWTSPTQLLVIARPFGDMPFQLSFLQAAQRNLPRRWRTTAQGQRSVTVVGSGRYLGLRPQEPPRRLLRLDLSTGRRTVLATGAFVDLALSPDGHRLALLENDGDVVMDARHAIQRDYGYENVHRRLVLLDLRGGGLIRPCPDRDLLLHPLRWSPDGSELLVYGRRDGERWDQGQLLRIAVAGGAATPIGDGVTPTLEIRPDAARAAWFADAPIVWGTPKGDPQAPPRWFRLTAGGPVPLGPGLRSESNEALTVTDHAVLLAADGDIWRIAPDGTAVRVAAGVRPFTIAQVDTGLLFEYDPPVGDHLLGMRSDGSGDSLVKVSETGLQTRARLPAGAEPLSSPSWPGALVRSFPGGAAQTLAWVSGDRPPAPVATVNATLADVTGPDVRAIQHTGPHGEPLTSWLLLPPARPGPPPPLIVRPYLGSTVKNGPHRADPRQERMDPDVVLLTTHGYAVLLPSLPRTLDGPGVTAGLADRVLGIIDIAAADPELGRRFDRKRLGLWGLSFGGYSTLAITTQTDRFGAAIAQASMSDLFSMWGAFSLGDRIDPRHGLSPFYQAGWVEDVQPMTGAPPWADPQRYLFDSPALHADRVTTPILLMHSELDSFPTSQPEEMFSGLIRQNKDAVLAIYWGENHIVRSPGNQRDMYARAFAWLDEHLGFAPTTATARPADDPAPAPASGARRPRSRPPKG